MACNYLFVFYTLQTNFDVYDADLYASAHMLMLRKNEAGYNKDEVSQSTCNACMAVAQVTAWNLTAAPLIFSLLGMPHCSSANFKSLHVYHSLCHVTHSTSVTGPVPWKCRTS
jgi:hypothetical protein